MIVTWNKCWKQNSEVSFMIIFQSESILQNPRGYAGTSFIYNWKEKYKLGWLDKFSIIKSYHSLCIRKIEININLIQLFLGKKG